jgi:FKBP-type peptidyl-prolyl cis-trans isomerase
VKPYNITILLGLALLLSVTACHKRQAETGFSRHPLGYYYQLISFDSDAAYRPNKIAWVGAVFKTQNDSVFWDSYNNLNDCLYLVCDSAEKDNFLKNYISRCSAQDSACLLINTKDFFYQQFKTAAIPYFCRQDSVVKVSLKVRQIFGREQFARIQDNLRQKEEEQIEGYFGSPSAMERAADPQGFFWLERRGALSETRPGPGDLLTITYTGYFLNGRLLERSGTGFEYIYGTPDQVLRGLNYVIGNLKLGESAKIILPSRLAFGENGSSDGSVPPYTPLVYEVQLTDIKTPNG